MNHQMTVQRMFGMFAAVRQATNHATNFDPRPYLEKAADKVGLNVASASYDQGALITRCIAQRDVDDSFVQKALAVYADAFMFYSYRPRVYLALMLTANRYKGEVVIRPVISGDSFSPPYSAREHMMLTAAWVKAEPHWIMPKVVGEMVSVCQPRIVPFSELE